MPLNNFEHCICVIAITSRRGLKRWLNPVPPSYELTGEPNETTLHAEKKWIPMFLTWYFLFALLFFSKVSSRVFYFYLISDYWHVGKVVLPINGTFNLKLTGLWMRYEVQTRKLGIKKILTNGILIKKLVKSYVSYMLKVPLIRSTISPKYH